MLTDFQNFAACALAALDHIYNSMLKACLLHFEGKYATPR